MNSASAFASSVLPTPVGPRKRKEPIGRLRVGEPGPRAPQRVGDRLDRLVLADHPVVQALLHVDQLLDLALHQAADRDPGPFGDDLGDVLLGHLVGEHRAAAGVQLGEPRLLLGDLLLELGDVAVAQLRRPLEVGLALGLLGLAPGLLELRLGLLDRLDRAPSRSASGRSAR